MKPLRVKVDIIIPSYNNLFELKACLASLQNQNFKDFRVFLCIDGSGDGTYDWIRNILPTFELIVLSHPSDENCGRAKTRNLSLKFLNSTYLIILDSDIIVNPTFIDDHIDCLKRNENNVISVGKVDNLYILKNIWGLYISTRGVNSLPGTDSLPDKYITTQNICLLTDVFIQTGGFDEWFVYYGGEDTEWSHRLLKSIPLKVINNLDAIGYTIVYKDLDQALKQLREFGEHNLPYIRKKHPHFYTIYKIGLINQNIIYKQLSKLFIMPVWVKLAKLALYLKIKRLSTYIVHFLAFAAIYEGYYLNKEKV